jgi:DNA-binding MarR family transcriptional regulator
MGLKEDGFMAWYGLMQAALRSLERIERDVGRGAGMPMSWFELLARLKGADDFSRRMSELAEDLLLSRGGVTRLVARLEEAGLVERITPPDDRRATFARLTARGREAVEEAIPVQVAAVRRYFLEAVDEEDIAALRTAAVKVLRHLGEECGFLEAEKGAPVREASRTA